MPIYSPSLSAGISTLGNTSGTTGMAHDRIVFQGGNNITLSQSNSANSATIIVSGANQTNQQMTMYGTGNTTQSSTGTNNASSLVFSGAGNVSVGISGGSIVISGGTAAPSPVNFSAGTTSGNLGSIVFSNLNGVTFGLNGSTITASVGVGGGGGAALKGSGTYTQNTGTVEFANSNGITFGLSNNGTMTASHNGITTGRASNDAIGLNTALTANGVSVTANSSGLSLNFPAFLTTAMLSNAATITAINFSAGTTSNNSAAIKFADSNGISFGLNAGTITGTVKTDYQSSNANYLTSQSNQAVSGANGSFTFQTITFANSNGVSFSTGTQGLYATVATNYQSQGAYLTTARASNDAIGLNSALTANGVSVTANSSGLSLNFPAFLTTAGLSGDTTKYAGVGSAITNGVMTFNTAGLSLNLSQLAGTGTTFAGANLSASMTFNSNGLNLSMSAAAPGGGGAINISAGTTSNNLQSIIFANANGVSFGLGTGASSQSLTASVNAGGGGVALAASNATFTSGTVVMSAAGGALTIGTGVQTINFSVPAQSQLSAITNITIGTTGSTIGFSVGAPPAVTMNSTVIGLRNRMVSSSSSSMGQNSLYIWPDNIQGPLAVSIIKIPVAMTFSSSAAASVQRGFTASFAVYTRNATNSTVLASHYSTSYTFAGSFNSNTSCAVSMITAVNNSTSYGTVQSTTTNGIGLSSLVHGVRELIMPFNTTFTAGEYWFAYANSTSSAGAAGAINFSHLVAISTQGNRLGVAINATNDGILRNMAMGTYSATTGAFPANISFTQVNAAATNPIVFMFNAQTV